jgi:hypothetical protein
LSLKEEWVLLFVLFIYRAWKKSEFCCLFCLYTEPERRVSFVVCFGYIQSLKEEWVLYNQNKEQNTLLFQTMYINKTKNKTHSSFSLCISKKQTAKLTLLSGSVYKQNIYRAWKKSDFCCLFCLYTETERGVCFVVCFGYIQSLKEESVLLFVLVKLTLLSVSVYNQNKEQNTLLFQSLYIKKTNNKTHSSFRLLFVFSVVCVAQCLVFCRSLFAFSVVCVAQCLVFCVHWATQTPLKTNNDLHNTTQNTKHWATQTPLKTNNDLQNTTQNTKHW